MSIIRVQPLYGKYKEREFLIELDKNDNIKKMHFKKGETIELIDFIFIGKCLVTFTNGNMAFARFSFYEKENGHIRCNMIIGYNNNF